MIAPLVGHDIDDLEARLARGPVVIAQDLPHGEAQELVSVCTSLGAEAHLLLGDDGQASTASGTLVGASVAGLIAQAGADEDPEVLDLARMALGQGRDARPHQTAAFASGDLQAALDDAVARRKAALATEPALPEPPDTAEQVATPEGHSTRVFGSFDAPPAPLPAATLGAAPAGRAASGPMPLDPFSVEAGDDRRQTVPRLPMVDRPPPLVAPPPSESAPLPAHAPLETSGFSSESGPLLFRMEPPAPKATETGSMPRPVRLSTHSHPPVGSRAPDTLTDEPIPGSESDPFGALRENPPQSRLARPSVGGVHEPPSSRARRRPPPPQQGPRSARRATADHSPGQAALLSLVLPGMGQVYNGQFERAGWYALGALLVLPWGASVVDAWFGAKAIRAGQRQAPSLRHRRRAVVSQLALNLSVFFVVIGGVVLYRMRTRPKPQPTRPVVSAPPLPTPVSAAALADGGAPTDAGVDAGDGAVDDAATRPFRAPIEADLPVAELMRKGQMAFDRGLYAEAEDIMHAIIRRQPGHKAAYRLLVEANTRRQALKAGPPAASGSAAPGSTPAGAPASGAAPASAP
ncbi:MAG: hypothetical protein H6702_04760 [Myxococcales bacterium]|nr:hypothetical protein [Myxococcales bacterium]